MELRDWATQVLSSDNLEDKLFTPDTLTDQNPGPAYLFDEPARTPEMRFRTRTKEEKLPSFNEHHDSEKRAICLHRFCGHELLAVEIMAQALLSFPDAPRTFRMGVANTLKEEQEHVRLYETRLREMGVEFGDLPLYRHFWIHVPYLDTPSHYLSAMSLTFEMANLDFAPMYRDSFARNGDEKSTKLMQRILDDEINHVSFGYHMLKKLNKGSNLWSIYENSLTPFLTLRRARGPSFHPEHRKSAGIPEDWIEKFSNK